MLHSEQRDLKQTIETISSEAEDKHVLTPQAQVESRIQQIKASQEKFKKCKEEEFNSLPKSVQLQISKQQRILEKYDKNRKMWHYISEEISKKLKIPENYLNLHSLYETR